MRSSLLPRLFLPTNVQNQVRMSLTLNCWQTKVETLQRIRCQSTAMEAAARAVAARVEAAKAAKATVAAARAAAATVEGARAAAAMVAG